MDEENDNYFDGESDNDEKFSLENVLMIMDDDSYIYYITKSQGVCFLKEVNPKESQLRNHIDIASFKAEYCLAFDTNGKTFFCIDDTKTVHVYERKINHRELENRGELNIKEFSR